MILMVSCVEHDFSVKTFECGSEDEVSYDLDVSPIVESSCAISGCHDGSNGADLNWNDFSKFQSHAAEVKDRITRPPGEPGHMPATGSITDTEIQTIVCWVDQGAQDN